MLASSDTAEWRLSRQNCGGRTIVHRRVASAIETLATWAIQSQQFKTRYSIQLTAGGKLTECDFSTNQDSLTSPPGFVAKGKGAAGFVELANLLISARNGCAKTGRIKA